MRVNLEANHRHAVTLEAFEVEGVKDEVRAPVSSFAFTASTPRSGRATHSRQPRCSGAPRPGVFERGVTAREVDSGGARRSYAVLVGVKLSRGS